MIRFSEHAIERFIERVRPALDRDAALDAMVRLRHIGQVTPGRPPWMNPTDDDGDVVAYLVAGDVAFPLTISSQADRRHRYVAKTTVVPGSIPAETRERRNRQRSGRMVRRKARKVAERRYGRAQLAAEFDRD